MKNILSITLFSVLAVFLLFNPCLASEKKVINDKEFTKINDFWVDENFIAKQAIEIQHNSKAYNMLIERNQEINDYLKLGKNIKVNINNQNIIISEDKPIINKDKSENAVVVKESKKSYAWAVIFILNIFFIAAVVFIIISAIHKKQRDL